MKRGTLRRYTPLRAKTGIKRRALRKGTTRKAINPATGRVLTVKGAKLRAWAAFAAYIRARDPYCITSAHPTTEAGHFLHNSDKVNQQLGGNALWYDERNVNGQCPYCNRHKSGNLALYSLRLMEKHGDGIIAELYRAFNTPRKWTIPELLEVADRYEAKLRDLRHGAKSVPSSSETIR